MRGLGHARQTRADSSRPSYRKRPPSRSRGHRVTASACPRRSAEGAAAKFGAEPRRVTPVWRRPPTRGRVSASTGVGRRRRTAWRRKTASGRSEPLECARCTHASGPVTRGRLRFDTAVRQSFLGSDEQLWSRHVRFPRPCGTRKLRLISLVSNAVDFTYTSPANKRRTARRRRPHRRMVKIWSSTDEKKVGCRRLHRTCTDRPQVFHSKAARALLDALQVRT